MSNTEIPATRPLGLALAELAWPLRVAVATTVLAVLWISFTPFEGMAWTSNDLAGNSRLINRIGYSALFLAVWGSALMFVARTALFRLISVSWIAMFAIIAVSAAYAPEPDVANRALQFSIIVTSTAAAMTILPPDARSFCIALLIAGGAVVGLSYAGVFLLPGAAIHQAFETESQHSGLWRGIFIHKNIAGPVMAVISFAGIYMFRRGWRITGLLLAAAAFVFVVQSGSKTSVALAPVVALMVWLPASLGLRALGALASVAAIAIAHALTVGTVYVPLFDDILRSYAPLTTYTGRVEIWHFGKEFIEARPWTGYGFDGFWGSPVILGADRYYDQTWDPRFIVHAHNGFMDVALQFGTLALIPVIWLTVIRPAMLYAATIGERENRYLADFFFMIVVFASLNSSLESFYFQRADPVWTSLVIAIFGLRMTSRFVVRS